MTRYALMPNLNEFSVEYDLTGTSRIISGTTASFRFAFEEPAGMSATGFVVTPGFQFNNNTDNKKLFARVINDITLQHTDGKKYRLYKFILETTETTYLDFTNLIILFNVTFTDINSSTTTSITF